MKWIMIFSVCIGMCFACQTGDNQKPNSHAQYATQWIQNQIPKYYSNAAPDDSAMFSNQYIAYTQDLLAFTYGDVSEAEVQLKMQKWTPIYGSATEFRGYILPVQDYSTIQVKSCTCQDSIQPISCQFVASDSAMGGEFVVKVQLEKRDSVNYRIDKVEIQSQNP